MSDKTTDDIVPDDHLIWRRDGEEWIEPLIHETWLDGYQTAVEAMRDWAEEFADEQTKAVILNCAGMVELAKPTKETLGG